MAGIRTALASELDADGVEAGPFRLPEGGEGAAGGVEQVARQGPDRLAGHLGLRRAALLRAEKKLDAALRELAEVKGLEGAANQIPRALLAEAEIRDEKGDAAAAKAARERVVKEFPQRPERREAEAKLAGKP